MAGKTMLVDRHIVHDLGVPATMRDVKERGRRVRNSALTFVTADHESSSAYGRLGTTGLGIRLLESLCTAMRAADVRMFDIGEPGQRIVHDIGPELGLTLPGVLLVCGDNHTCTQGAMGALAPGIGSTDLIHVLARQILVQARPEKTWVRFEERMGPGVTDTVASGARTDIANGSKYISTTEMGDALASKLTALLN